MAQPEPQSIPTELDARLHQMEEELRRLGERHERRPAALIQRMVPPEVRTHLRAARREQLLAVRAWIDSAIERVDAPKDERPRRPESVRIQ